jgi:hypothetical protein
MTTRVADALKNRIVRADGELAIAGTNLVAGEASTRSATVIAAR